MFPIFPAGAQKRKCENCPKRHCKEQLVTVGSDTRGEGPSYFSTAEGTRCAYVSATSCYNSGISTTLFEYYNLNKKEAYKKNLQILKHLQQCTGISARMQLWFPEVEDNQCFKNIKTNDSITAVREKMVEMLHKNFMKPDHIRIENLGGEPSETDNAITKYAIEHQVDIAVLTRYLPPMKILRYIIEQFTSGLALSHLRFYWAHDFLNIEELLEGFRVIYRGDVEARGGKPCCRRNFAYVQAVEDGPVLSVAYGDCAKKNCGRTYDYHSGTHLRRLYDLSFIVRG